MKALLEYLATFPENGRFHGYQLTKIEGGRNNVLYRATSPTADWAVKFTIRDARQRARREFLALTAVQQQNPALAPKPLFLDETSYAQPMVVQQWTAGEVKQTPPETDAEWQLLIGHYANLAQIVPEQCDVAVETAVINFANTVQAWEHIDSLLCQMPIEAHPPELQPLLTKLQTRYPLDHTIQRRALCRVDANLSNMLWQKDKVVSVDWENSGWGDPAFEIADLVCHPAYESVSMARWRWVIAQYGQMVGDDTAVNHIHTMIPFMLTWWVARLARMLYDIPRGNDHRLVPPNPTWQEDLTALMMRYVERANAIDN